MYMDATDVKRRNSHWSTRAAITVSEAAEVLGVGRTTAYEAVRAGQIPHVRIGRRVLVPVPALRKLLDDHE